MYCQTCGKELPGGATSCPSCHATVFYPPPPPNPSDPLDQILSDVKHAASDLLAGSARLSGRLADHAEAAAKDPSGSAKKAARRVAKELDAAAKEVDRVLKGL